MTGAVLPAPVRGRHAGPTERSALAAVAGLVAGEIRRGALVVLLVTGAMTALTAITYRGIVAGDVAGLAALASSSAIRTLFGEPIALDTAGGFTVWRTGTPLAVLVAAWSALTAVRVTRGEEDAGRGALLAAGRAATSAVVSCQIAVVAAAGLLAGAVATCALLVAGADGTGAVLHGLGLGLVAVLFAGVGGLAAQVWSHRGAASAAGAAVLATTLLARMIGDGVDALSWLRWTSPVGLLALARPYADDRVLPLVVLGGAAIALVVAAPWAAARRDLGAGLLGARTRRPARLRLLGSVPAFAVRRLLGPLAAWALGVAAYFGLVGLVGVSATAFLRDNPRFAALAEQAGMGGLDEIAGYAAALFAVLAVPLGVFAAVRTASVADEEAAGRLTLLLAGPVRRSVLVLAEAAVTALGVVALAIVAAVAFGAGAGLAGAGLSMGAALAGALNLVPVALLCLGAAVAALGWRARWTAAVGALPAVGGFLLQVLAENAGAPTWVLALSPFRHVAPVPLTGPHWPGAVVMGAVAVSLLAVGVAGYVRRDLGP